MKILEITTIMRGGAGMFLTRLAKSLIRRGHIVDVVSTGQSGELVDWEKLCVDLKADGVHHYQLNFFKRDNEIFWEEARKLSELLKKGGYDLIHVHSGVPAYAAFVANRMAETTIPVIATFHSWGKDRPVWMNIADTWAFNRCDKVFFVSKEYMRYVQSVGLKNSSGVIYPGLYVEPSRYLPDKLVYRNKLREDLKLSPHARILTHLGEITYRKGQVDLVKALHGLDDIYLLLIGEGRDTDYQTELIATIDKFNLQSKVRLMGWVKDPYEIIVASDLFVFPSYSEGLGLAPLEAVVLEVPTIFSLVEGTKDIAEVLGEDNFGTFEPGNYQAIRQLITKVIGKDEATIREQAKKAARRSWEVFNFEQTVDSYENEMLALVK